MDCLNVDLRFGSSFAGAGASGVIFCSCELIFNATGVFGERMTPAPTVIILGLDAITGIGDGVGPSFGSVGCIGCGVCGGIGCGVLIAGGVGCDVCGRVGKALEVVLFNVRDNGEALPLLLIFCGLILFLCGGVCVELFIGGCPAVGGVGKDLGLVTGIGGCGNGLFSFIAKQEGGKVGYNTKRFSCSQGKTEKIL